MLIRYALAAVLLAGCSAEPEKVPVPAPEPLPGNCPVVFGAANGETTAAGTRSLIGNKDSEAGMTTLAKSCTPSEGGEAIAVWGDCRPNGTPRAGVEYTTVFSDAHLIYDAGAGDNPHSFWNYEGSARYWLNDRSYRFRAYYPASVEPVSSSNVMTLSLEYQSNRAQDDLLVAYNEADTASPTFDPGEPVELYFRHTLAALRFEFELGYYNTDRITSCWLENSARDDFAVAGILFCERRETGGRIFTSANPPVEDDAAKTHELDAFFRWLKGYCPEPVYDSFYKWSGKEGLPIRYDESGEKLNAVLYRPEKPEDTTRGELFTRNGGWLLILPQESSGNLQLCFQTRNGGASAVFRVNIPRNTNTQLYDEEGNPRMDEKGEPVYGWRAGKRYSYKVLLQKSDMQVSLAVADWNMRYSSTQIEF